MHTMEYYLLIKRGGVLIHMTSWMNSEDTIISERTHRDTEDHIL